MDSKRKKIFKFLEKNPKASNNKLYKSFPDFNESSIRIYKKQFLETYNENITYKPKKDFALLETFLTELNILPAIIFVKLYWKIKEIQKNEISDFSVVDLYQEIFSEYFVRSDKINEIYDLSFKIYQRIGEVCADMDNELFSPEKDEQYRKMIMRKMWKSTNLCGEIGLRLHSYLFEESGALIKFKESEKKSTLLDTIRFIEAYILVDYIILEFYERMEFLKNRDLKYNYRDLKKVDFLCYKASRINGKFIGNHWRYDEKGSTILEYVKNTNVKSSRFEIGYSNDPEDDKYLEYIEQGDVDDSQWKWIQTRLKIVHMTPEERTKWNEKLTLKLKNMSQEERLKFIEGGFN